MNQKKINSIIALISITILITIGIQLFWNYENYQTNKQVLFNEVQNSFEDVIKNYFTEGNKKRTATFIDLESDSGTSLDRVLDFTKIGEQLDLMDSTSTELPDFSGNEKLLDSAKIKIIPGVPTREEQAEMKQFKNSFTLTVDQDSIDLLAIAKPFQNSLTQKNIKTSFRIEHYKKDSIFAEYGDNLKTKEILETLSSSELIPVGESLKLSFTNPISSIFKRGLIGILVSLTLALAIIFSLLYLMRIIKKQKELSEIKNDLISNITHEFKTPIATVLAAIEGITGFSSENQNTKTEKYLQISKDQLHRLNTMVEKLLETAAINSESLELKKSSTDIVPFVQKIINSAKHNYPNKNIIYNCAIESEVLDIDEFHLENAINNLIDNAVKYGGETVNITLNKKEEKLHISVIDNGIGIPAAQHEKIFDKFYRIPSGNKHDIKGFGIGLYYTNNIILKHGGKLDLISAPNSNEFRISL